jgi:hypothetical protein
MMRIDAQLVGKMLKQAPNKAHMYVKNELRKENPEAYANTIRIQNQYITKVKTIILVGTTRLRMSDLRPLLLGGQHIHYVAATTKLKTIGRWDILTDMTPIAQQLSNQSIRNYQSGCKIPPLIRITQATFQNHQAFLPGKQMQETKVHMVTCCIYPAARAFMTPSWSKKAHKTLMKLPCNVCETPGQYQASHGPR